MEARICMQLLCMKLCFISQKHSQIDDFQDVTGQILKVINLALFLDDFQDVAAAGDILPYLSHRRHNCCSLAGGYSCCTIFFTSGALPSNAATTRKQGGGVHLSGPGLGGAMQESGRTGRRLRAARDHARIPSQAPDEPRHSLQFLER